MSQFSEIRLKTLIRRFKASDEFFVVESRVEAFPGVPNQFAVSEGEFGYTINNDKWIWTLDKESGEILSKYACFDLENWDGNITNSTEIIAIGPVLLPLRLLKIPMLK